MKKLAALVFAGALLVAVPAAASPVKNGFLSIRGPEQLKPGATLRIPIRCSVECSTTTRTILKLPGDDIPPSIAKGHLQAGEPKNLVVTLNQNALDEINSVPGGSRIRVKVLAKSAVSGQRVRAVKVFEFTVPSP